MKKRLIVLGLSALTVVACRAVPEQQLKDSFVQQIASSGIVRDFQQKGDEVLFAATANASMRNGACTSIPPRSHVTRTERHLTKAWLSRRGM
jgi:hypothetical protein